MRRLLHVVARDTEASGLEWLVRVRWITILSQATLLLGALALLGPKLDYEVIGALIALLALSNAALPRLRFEPDRVAAAAMLLDTALFTVMLHLTGSESNPLSVLYLVHVTLAAVALRTPYAWTVTAATIVSYGALFLSPSEGHAHHAARQTAFSSHLQGMWLGFALAAVLITFLVARVRTELERQRERAATSARLASLVTFAAGAAHELATPLSTIKLIARELEREFEGADGRAELLDDIRSIQSEVARGRVILDRLAAGAGEFSGEAPRQLSIGDLIEAFEEELGRETASRIDIHCANPDATVVVPARAVAQVIANLVRNGLDASETAARVDLAIFADAHGIAFEIVDRGVGMSAETLARAGEPFFTTKPPGSGTGLGLYLVRALVAQLGGTLSIESQPERGTTARLDLPRGVRS